MERHKIKTFRLFMCFLVTLISITVSQTVDFAMEMPQNTHGTVGIYEFGDVGEPDSGGSGFRTQGDKFLIPNDYSASTVYSLKKDFSDGGVFILRAEKGSTCHTFTLENLTVGNRLETQEILGFDVQVKDYDGNLIASHSLTGESPTVSPFNTLALRDMDFNNPWPAGGYDNVSELRIEYSLDNPTNNFEFMTVTVSNINSNPPGPNYTVIASVDSETPKVGADNPVTLTVLDSSGNIDTNFNGDKDVTITGVEIAPDGSYGSFAGTALTADSAGEGQVISVNFTNGVATENLNLTKDYVQIIRFSVSGVTIPSTDCLLIKLSPEVASTMTLTQDITAPSFNGSVFNQSAVITLKDQYGNICTNDNTTSITVSKEDAGDWTLTGTITQRAHNGVVKFFDLGASNRALVNNAQLGFTSEGLSKLMSNTVILPALIPNFEVNATIATLTPKVGEDNLVTLTVKDSFGDTNTNFNGLIYVTVGGVKTAPDGSLGSFAEEEIFYIEGRDQHIPVIFTDGVATAYLNLTKAEPQYIFFSLIGVYRGSNTLTVSPSHEVSSIMTLTQDITAPSLNYEPFEQQPVIVLKDIYGNICTNDNTTVITASKEDGGDWSLSGTTDVTANVGVVSFTDLFPTNFVLVNNAQLGFTSGSLSKVTSSTVTLPAPLPHYRASVGAETLAPKVGTDNLISLYVLNSLAMQDTFFNSTTRVTIKGVKRAPDGSYGSFAGTTLNANSESIGQCIDVTFTNGVATENLVLNNAELQRISFSIDGATTPGTGGLTITPSPEDVTTMILTQDITAPSVNGTFAQQPVLALKDVYGNVCTNDNTTVITASKEDGGDWSLSGTTDVIANAGVVSFTDLGALNRVQVNDAQLGFTSVMLPKVTSTKVTLRAPFPHYIANANIVYSMPKVGSNNLVILTVKDSLGFTDTNFSGAKKVTIAGVQVAPDGSYGSFAGTALRANSAGKGQEITVNFTDGVASENLSLTKAGTQTIEFSVSGVTTQTTNELTVMLTSESVNSLNLTQDIIAPESYGEMFAQQPVIMLKDIYGNICNGDNTTKVTVSKEDSAAWTLTGTKTITANSGVVTFTDLGVSNRVLVHNAQLGFISGVLPKVMSTAVTLPEPKKNYIALANSSTLSPKVGEDNLITLTVRNSAGDNDRDFNGVKNVTITGVETAPDDSYGTFAGVTLDATSQWTGQGIPVTFTNGVATEYLSLTKADLQIIGFSISGVTIPKTNPLGITLAHESVDNMVIKHDIVAPSSNGAVFAQQPMLILKDRYGNICSDDNTTIVTAVKEDSGSWTLGGTKAIMADSGVVKFTDLVASNTALVNNAQLAFTSGSIPKVTSVTVTLPRCPSSGKGSSSGGSSSSKDKDKKPNNESTIVLVNGKKESAVTEKKTIEQGKKTVSVKIKHNVIKSKINEAINKKADSKNNEIEILVGDNKSDVANVELNGETVKSLEKNTFDVKIKYDKIQYNIPAKEFTISKVAKKLDVDESDLEDIKIEVKLIKLDKKTITKYSENAKRNKDELLFPPVSFKIFAKTTKTNGTTEELEINKFTDYVERVLEIPEDVDYNHITTGIVFNADGSYSHVPTEVFNENNKWYAKISSLTNSDYSVISNPLVVDSVENHWSKDAVNDMASRLVITAPESFNPTAEITRADFAEYIVRALGLFRKSFEFENKFNDVKSSDEKALAISIASGYGIVVGDTKGDFRPNAIISREEAMTMYQKAMNIVKLSGTDNNRYLNYTDYEEVADWAVPYVREVLSAHVFNGTTPTTLSPKSKLTYAEAVQAIKNLLVESGKINE